MILFRPYYVVDRFSNEFSDSLHRKSLIILSTFSLLRSALRKSDYFESQLLLIISVVISILLTIVFYQMLSFLIHWLTRKLKGKGEFEEIEFIIACSTIPLMLGFLVNYNVNPETFLNMIGLKDLEPRFYLSILMRFWSLAIMYFGFKRLNQLNYKRNLLLMAPLVLLFFFIMILSK
jgi:hypothetical protein